jgi:hypothetical protein
MKNFYIIISWLFFLFTNVVSQQDNNRIKPYDQNNYYWQYKGKPLMLTGGSKDDNLFQIKGLKSHLDQMAKVKANYIRNTMSERNIHGNEVSAFLKDENNKYNLSKWNPEYWNRLDSLLDWCYQRDIIVQIEIWATHDFFKQERWNINPWNPDMNYNYEWNETKQKKIVSKRAKEFHPFFNTVPNALNDTMVLSWQKKYVDKIMEHSLPYPNVLYCITNEIQQAQTHYWSKYWAIYLHQIAKRHNTTVQVTEMFWMPDLKGKQHKHALDHPRIFTFFESSQNSAISGQQNWDNLQYVRNYINDNPRPINAVKVYGKTSETKWPGTDNEAIDRFWRNILGGCASTRFHRNENGKYGLGWSSKSINSLKAANIFLKDIKPWNCLPANDILINREENEAYAIANEGVVYGVFFTGNGSVDIDLGNFDKNFTLKWINAFSGRIANLTSIIGGKTIKLTTPDEDGKWIVIIKEE